MLDLSKNTSFLVDMTVNQKKEKMTKKILSSINLKNLVNLETLQQIQNNLVNVTGIAMVTVDYRGVPITEETSFTSFCKARREISQGKVNCFFSDAYGSLKAAMTNTPYVYRCPMGLVDCAVPIIVEGTHLGGVLLGQVRCDEEIELESIENLVQNEISLEDYPQLKEKYYETKIVKLSEIEHTGQLVKYLVSDMVEKQVALIVQEELYNEMERLQTKIKLLESELKLEANDKNNLFQGTSQFMLSTLTIINSMAIIDDSSSISDVVSNYAKLLKDVYEIGNDLIAFSIELDFMKKTIEIMEKYFEKKIDFIVETNCPVNDYRIPPFILYTFIENAILHGILPSNKPGKIKLKINQKQKFLIIEIIDNGIGIDFNYQNNKKNKKLENYDQNILSSLDINMAKKRLEDTYGVENVVIKIEQNVKGSGTTSTLTVPVL
ncbi:PocR ligand-binding domain-containing protein [Vagococcus sp.]|uniref:PocR ligand-binding domain-containing protein n=1 Tax=Vagococcus sp. TaxID=1933889 RepID=UPI003F9D8338